ncbi:lysine-rich nucleolar protein 1-like isoform X2 [Mya arenaria]|uniref:lysine-rich nucleolar protein 1-like isoform X2 n=1 Tax=Mya arenaria TaxID=6604 RepID=UPI0022DFB52C|nr:lysine-rich nucleolar protein 1-like isoform X2 [Mya arenaria]
MSTVMGKNKRKRHEESSEPGEEVACTKLVQDNNTNNAEVGHSGKKKKKDKSKHNNAIDITQESLTIKSDEAVDDRPKKKHKKKHRPNLDESVDSKFESNDTSSIDVKQTPNYDSEISKKKKKKKKSKERTDKSDETDQNLNGSIEHSTGKKRKKSKHKNVSEIPESALESKEELLEINVDKEANSNNSHMLQTKHKKKKKHKKEDSSVDNDFKKDVHTNADGFLPKNKQTAVQKDSISVGTDSLKENLKSDKEQSNNKKCTVGQWESAEFEDTDRQNKFYRLLGGMKKTNSSNLLQKKFQLGCSGKPFKPGGTGAMNRNEQDKYTKTLESDFEKALSSNRNKGIGLGFEKPPDEGKKFFIDTRKSNSIKFDD